MAGPGIQGMGQVQVMAKSAPQGAAVHHLIALVSTETQMLGFMFIRCATDQNLPAMQTDMLATLPTVAEQFLDL